MSAKVGFWQEIEINGIIANSFMRLLVSFFFLLTVAYWWFSKIAYDNHFSEYVKLLRENCITEQSFNMLISNLRLINWDVFLILVIATTVPKAIQKFAEMKTGIKTPEEKPGQP